MNSLSSITEEPSDAVTAFHQLSVMKRTRCVQSIRQWHRLFNLHVVGLVRLAHSSLQIAAVISDDNLRNLHSTVQGGHQFSNYRFVVSLERWFCIKLYEDFSHDDESCCLDYWRLYWCRFSAVLIFTTDLQRLDERWLTICWFNLNCGERTLYWLWKRSEWTRELLTKPSL